MLEEYFKELGKFDAIPKEEEHELLVKAKSGDRKAYEKEMEIYRNSLQNGELEWPLTSYP